MIPLSDQSHRSGSVPFVTVTLIVINVIVFLYQMTLSDPALEQFVLQYGVRPIEITTGRDIAPLLPTGLPVWVTLLTSMFMHGGWLHLGGNMLYLWVFGDNIEDTFGKVPYLVFYLVTGLAAAAAQIISDTGSRIPSVGASGAIAGVLGAYLILHPTNKVNTLLTLGYFIRIIQIPALIVLGFWIVLQFFNGAVMAADDGVAYWAHIGGFVAGMALAAPAALMNRNARRPAGWWETQ